jgi:V/A-type H+-transporting ATPase subunit A
MPGRVEKINGPVIEASGMTPFAMREMVTIGEKKLIGEVIRLSGDHGTLQVYEETEGLTVGATVDGTGKPLSVTLGPGLVGGFFDGIQRPLSKIAQKAGAFIPEGVGLATIDLEKPWSVEIAVKEGDTLEAGDLYATIEETPLIRHRLLVPAGISGEVIRCLDGGEHPLTAALVTVKTGDGGEIDLLGYQEWPVRDPRPIEKRLGLAAPLITGQRIIDVFFPLAKGGTAAIPGGFGTGKTMTQHQLAKWSDADLIVYVGCGERGNEMTDVLEAFPKLEDPRSGRPMMERTILIANTSNMPVAAREASLYTGITLAEYYRDMGYHVALMADSTSRWAEALREISGRLEEMPAEEGYPAYLASRLAAFYERAGRVRTLSGDEASVTLIGAVSPAGGDFSEPVTENTKRFIGTFFALDRELAYARHYPAINWLDSYSGYASQLEAWYRDHVSDDYPDLRQRIMALLKEESELSDIVQLVGEDVLPDDQRLTLSLAQIVRVGFLQQNAFHDQDTYVPLAKQILMLEVIAHLVDRSRAAVAAGIPYSKVVDEDLFGQITRMKYNVPNDDLAAIGHIDRHIDEVYDRLMKTYGKEGSA